MNGLEQLISQQYTTRAYLAAIIDSSHDAIISKDLNGIIRSWNRGAERIFGYQAEEAIGQHISMLVVPDRIDEIPNILQRITRGERIEHYETVRQTKRGQQLAISLTVSPIRDETGKIIGASKIARDISGQVRAQRALEEANEQLVRSNRDLEQFAYSASHDLQEPLRMVCAYSDMLKARFGNQLGERGDEYLGYILAGALQMERLLHDLRAFTQATTSENNEAQEVDSSEVLQGALANLRTAIETSGALISEAALPPVRMHAFQLQQLFQNLIGNAIRYRTEEMPTVHIAGQGRGEQVTFSVRDNGIGIDPQYKEQIFGLFKRLHTSADYPGTGMGLAICQRIVERAGGTSGWNPNSDEVQRFSLLSPAPQGAEAGVNEEAKCILLVEDNAGDARLVREALEHHSIRCKLILIRNGERAIEFVRSIDAGKEGCPELIILDLNLPRRPGKEVLGSIRASKNCRNVTVAILSSSDSQTDKDDAARLGASRYIKKPSRLTEFLELGSVFKEMLQGPVH